MKSWTLIIFDQASSTAWSQLGIFHKWNHLVIYAIMLFKIDLYFHLNLIFHHFSQNFILLNFLYKKLKRIYKIWQIFLFTVSSGYIERIANQASILDFLMTYMIYLLIEHIDQLFYLNTIQLTKTLLVQFICINGDS